MAPMKILARSVVVGLLFCGCSSRDQTTVETQCREIFTVYCGRAYSECTSSKELFDACVSNGTTTCCADQCSATAGSTQSSIDQCTADIHKLACSSLSNLATAGAGLPATCQGVVQAASATIGTPSGIYLASGR
jgi:hypothetical protein